MNDKTFNREQYKRVLQHMITTMDEAALAESEGDFEKMDQKDKQAAVTLSITVIQVITETENEEGYLSESLKDAMDRIKKDG